MFSFILFCLGGYFGFLAGKNSAKMTTFIGNVKKKVTGNA